MKFIDQLERVKIETLQYFNLPEEQLQQTYGPGKWSVRYILHHLADSESVLFYRIRRVISEPKQVIWATDAAAWADKLDYSTIPLDLAKNVYITSRDGIIHHARHHYAGSDKITFVHSETGIRTLKDEFDKVILHNLQHIATVKEALGI